MINQKKILAIIPARGGSKRLPRKNVLEFGGVPLIAWTITAAKKSKYIDKAILSSDDEEICTIAKKYGCEVPFIRPSKLSTDSADSASMVLHAIEVVGGEFDIIILLQPTSPFRNEYQIDEALENFVNRNITTLVSVTPINIKLDWLFSIDNDNKLNQLLGSELKIYQSDIRPIYSLNGAIYILDKQYFVDNKKFIDENTRAFIMDINSSLDIDTSEDFKLGEFMLGSSFS